MYSQKTSTPSIIQRAWNDGLFTVRERRNGIIRGSTIEEKAMYVLGLGWKFRGTSEVKDSEVESTLFISLQGLTQEAKFLKIGQVLWEQCSQDFILKMISSLSSNTPSQSKLFSQIASNTEKNFKGYFSRHNNSLMRRFGVNPSSVLNRESKQMADNSKAIADYNKNIKSEKESLAAASASSKGFDRRVVRFKASSKEGKRLAEEIEVILKVEAYSNILDYAVALGIPVETGFRKNYVIEAVKASVVQYFEIQMLNNKMQERNVIYVRPSVTGERVIKALIKRTSFAIIAYDENITMKDIEDASRSAEVMKENMKTYKKLLGKGLSAKKINKEGEKRDYIAKKTTGIETKNSILFGLISKKSIAKFDKSNRNRLYEALSSALTTNLSLRNENRDGSSSMLSGKEAFDKWVDLHKNELSMARSISTEDMHYSTTLPDGSTIKQGLPGDLTFKGFTRAELVDRLIGLAMSMDIPKEYLSMTESSLTPSHPGYYLVPILRRYYALFKQVKGNNTLEELINKEGKKKNNAIAEILANIRNNVGKGNAERSDNKKFEADANGIVRPISISPEHMKTLYEQMKGVYVVGGSIYTFNGGTVATSTSGLSDKDVNAIGLEDSMRKFSHRRTRESALASIKSRGGNAMAHGTILEEMEMKEDESKESFLRRVIDSKLITELQNKGLDISSTIQPVFMVNKGITTSNIEATALLNLLPEVLGAIPLVGKAAGMLMESLLESKIDEARSLPKFAVGGSFKANNTNISQFISGDSINNRINPERVTIDWASQRVNVQPVNNNNTVNNVTQVEKGRITDPILGTPTSSVKVSTKNGDVQAMPVINAVNPFGEKVDFGDVSVTPMEILISLKESLTEIAGLMSANVQAGQSNASLTAQVVDAIGNLNNITSGGSTDIFGSIGRLAKGE